MARTVGKVAWAALWVATAVAGGCAARGQILGAVVDAAGTPLPRAELTLRADPSAPPVSVRSDQAGRFAFVALGEGEGAAPLLRRHDYALEVFKPGYHLVTASFRYERGVVELPPVTLVAESLEVPPDAIRLELGLITPATHATGATYEGQ